MSSGGSRKALRREWSPYAEYGRQGRLFPTFGRVDAVLVVLLLLGACFFLWRSETIAAYRWSWPELADFLVRRTPGGYEPGLLIRGLIVTLRLGVWSMALASPVFFRGQPASRFRYGTGPSLHASFRQGCGGVGIRP